MMKRILIAASTLAILTAPALAQDMGTTPPPPADSTMPPPAAPAPDATMPPAAPAPAETPAPAPDSAPMGAPPATAAAPAMGGTPTDWAKFDDGNKGYLTALEFGNWLMAKQGNDMSAQVEKTKRSKAAGLSAVKVLNATGSEFLKADKNGDRHITPDELAAYTAG